MIAIDDEIHCNHKYYVKKNHAICNMHIFLFFRWWYDMISRNSILFSKTKISKISSQLEISNVYLILFCRLFWTTRFRAEQTNGAESASAHSATRLLGLSDIVDTLFSIRISVSLTSSKMWPHILFALTEELAYFLAISMVEPGWLVSSITPLLAESSWWSSAAFCFLSYAYHPSLVTWP
jgi:hypothetical protein